MAFGRKKHRILELEAWRQQLVESRKAAVEDALEEAGRVHAAQCERLADEVMKARREAVAAEADACRTRGRNRHLMRLLDGSSLAMRHATLLAACARYRELIAEQEKRITGLERQLDDALGMDTDPRIAAGVDWQDRRVDKHTPHTQAASPSARLPRREPGLSGVDA